MEWSHCGESNEKDGITKQHTCNVPLLRCKTIALLVRNHVRRNGSLVISSDSLGVILAPAYNAHQRNKYNLMTNT